jgi:hypothetical protein
MLNIYPLLIVVHVALREWNLLIPVKVVLEISFFLFCGHRPYYQKTILIGVLIFVILGKTGAH